MTSLVRLRALLVLILLFGGATAAQNASENAPSSTLQSFPEGATLAAIRVEGASTSLDSLIRVNLVSRAGVPVADIDLEAERNRVVSMGSFQEVSLSIEASAEGPVLFVRVEENPPIRQVALRGITIFPDALPEIRNLIAQQNYVAAGQIYNSRRAREAIASLQAIYQQNAAYPGAIPVTLEVQAVGAQDAGASDDATETENPEAEAQATADAELADARAVRLVYTVNETPAIDTVTFSGNTVLGADELADIFRPLENLDTFDIGTYNRLANEVGTQYADLGYRGSGVNAAESTLTGGTLNVAIQELTILSLNTTAIGIDPAQFSLGPGDLYNYDTLLEDVNRLAAGRSEDIRLEPSQPIGGAVQVVFASGPPASAGPITQINISGNTVFTDAELRLQLSLNVGDTFTSVQAAEDFTQLQAFYTQAGYLLVATPDYNFRNGVYSQRLQEIKIAGYQVDLQTAEPRTARRVITRYLPPVGSVYNQTEMDQDMIQISQLQVVRIAPIGSRIAHDLRPTDNPARVIVRFIAEETPSRTISPAAELSTEGGLTFGADVAVSDNNLFGLAHSASASLSATTSDIGFLLGGNISYTVPWLDIDFLDFKTVPTTVSGELFSETASNQQLLNKGSQRVCPSDPEADSAACPLIGEYTERNTGFRFSVGRPIIPNLSANVSAQFTNTDYFTEPSDPDNECKTETPGEGSTCTLPSEQAQAYIPQSGFNAFLGSNVAYDTRNNPQAPTSGYRFTIGGGVGFGNDYSPNDVQQGYTYEQLEVGARTYITPFANPNHVFAFRFNAGHQFGVDYPTSRLFVVGDTNNEATQIRGYRREDIDPSRSYVVGTAEYRYDFGLSTAVTQTIVGIGFLDLGYASSVPGFENYQTPLLGSVGVALQLNIGFGGGLALPPLRFDYGISPKNPTGVFGFRLGFNF